MKNILALVMLMVLSSAAFAVEKPGSTGVAIIRKGSTFNLFYKGDKLSDVKVCIRDRKDQVVFTETIRKVEGFIRPYNFSTLPEDDYTIEITDNTRKQVEKVSYRNGQVQKLGSLVALTGEAGKYLLMVPNKGEDVLNVKIFNEESQTIYEHTEKISGDFARVYNLKDIKGNFVVEITDKAGNHKLLSL